MSLENANGCGNCHACLVGATENGYPVTMQRMIVCPDCGNKRCPKASNHRYECTNSNEPNQRGSIYTNPAKLTDEEVHKIWASENGLEDCDMCKFDDFLQTFRFIEKVILRKTSEK